MWVMGKRRGRTVVREALPEAEPGDDAGEGRVAARDAEERAEVLDAEGRVGDVDREADGKHAEAEDDEGRAHFEFVGVVGGGEEDNGCEAGQLV